MKSSKFVFLLLIFIFISNLFSQQDTLIFKNGQMIIGDIKSMKTGVLVIETDYSDSDFNISWGEVAEIYTVNKYMITLETGENLLTLISTASFDKSKLVILRESGPAFVTRDNIVTISPVEDTFIDRLNASVDAGVTVTKANNLRQFTLRSNIGYITPKWSTNASFDAVQSAQDSIADTKRTEIKAGFNYILYKRFYALVQVNFLQNEELNLELRSNPKLGVGFNFIQTNAMYLSVIGGAAFNNEVYTIESEPDRESGEAFLGSELNMFDFGDLGILSNIIAYKGITEENRWRVDFKIDFKYDLPYDLYIKLGYTHNYDNEPALGATENDYVFQTTFGWEL